MSVHTSVEMELSAERRARAAAERTLHAMADELNRALADRDRATKRAIYLEGVLVALYGEAKAVVGVVDRLNKIEPIHAEGGGT